jgi:hypothetical protein
MKGLNGWAVRVEPPAPAFFTLLKLDVDHRWAVPYRFAAKFTAPDGHQESVEIDWLEVEPDGRPPQHLELLRREALVAAAVPAVVPRDHMGMVSRADYRAALADAEPVDDTLRRHLLALPIPRPPRSRTPEALRRFAAKDRTLDGDDRERAKAHGLSKSSYYEWRNEARARGFRVGAAVAVAREKPPQRV